MKRPQRDPVGVNARLVDGDDVLTAGAGTMPLDVAGSAAPVTVLVAAHLKDDSDTLTAKLMTAWPAVAMLKSPSMVRTPKMIRTPELIRT